MENKIKKGYEMINKNNETNNTTPDETLKAFEDCYDVIVSNRVNLTLLETLFDNFISLSYKHTSSHKVIGDKQTEITNKLLPTLTKEQKTLFEKYDILLGEELQDYGLQCFITGALIAGELNSETNNFYNDSKNLKDLVEQIKKIKQDNNLL